MRPIDRLDDTIQDLTTYMAGLAPEKLAPSQTSRWGALEVFIHIVFWHEQYALITRALLKDEPPPLLTGSHVDINARAVADNLDVSLPVLLERLQKAQAELFPLYDQAVELRMAFKDGWRARPYPQAIDVIEQHIRSHLERLKKRYH